MNTVDPESLSCDRVLLGRPYKPWFYMVTCLAGLINAMIGTVVSLLGEAEVVLANGPIQIVLAIIVYIGASRYQHQIGIVLSLAMVGICVLMCASVLAFNLSPTEAEIPFAWMGSIFIFMTTPLVILTFRNPPVRRQPWQCPQCRYPIVGLASNSCPECGESLDSRLVSKYQHAVIPD